jgi:hypothetical protein
MDVMTDEGMDWARVLLSLVDLATQAHSSASVFVLLVQVTRQYLYFCTNSVRRMLTYAVRHATQAHSSAQQADDKVLAQAVSALGLFLLLAPHAVGSRFADTGGYVALQGMLCNRRLTLPQQRACAQGMQSWLVPPGDGVLASPR